MKILVVDDEPGELVLYREVLPGFEHEGYLSAESALAALRDHGRDFAFAIVDLMMPGMSGLEFLAEAKVIAPEMPTIVVSCLGEWHAKNLAFAAGAALYIEKPIDVSRFRELIERVRGALG